MSIAHRHFFFISFPSTPFLILFNQYYHNPIHTSLKLFLLDSSLHIHLSTHSRIWHKGIEHKLQQPLKQACKWHSPEPNTEIHSRINLLQSQMTHNSQWNLYFQTTRLRFSQVCSWTEIKYIESLNWSTRPIQNAFLMYVKRHGFFYMDCEVLEFLTEVYGSAKWQKISFPGTKQKNANPFLKIL